MKIIRGLRVPQNPEISIIVMAVDSDPSAISALASIQGQNIEKILVNTGEGTLSDKIGANDFVLVEDFSKRLPGGTRNLGIKESRAKIISFLAADCLVDRDTLDKRIIAHDKGYKLVSSALRPSSNSLFSWASYIYVHKKRMPEFQKGKGSLFGVSYCRTVFDELGYFDEEMRVSEDTHFNNRCSHLTYLQSKDIITYHNYPETLRASIADASIRAVREMRHRGRSRIKQATSELYKSIKLCVTVALTLHSPMRARFAAILLPILGAGAAVGCLLARDTPHTQ
jgi:hypothetical protein